MDFSNLFFLYILFPSAILIYFLMPDMKKKNLALLVISLVFYSMGQPIYLGFMVLLSWLNYKLALKIDPDDRSTVILPVAINIGILLVFRHLDFFLSAVGLGIDGGLLKGTMNILVNGLNSIGFSFRVPAAVLPTGICVYTLSVISYLMDVYNDVIAPEEDFQTLLLFFLMFPKLLLGPIVRYEQVADQLMYRRHHPQAVFEGVRRFLFGLGKKVLLADCCGIVLAELNSTGADTTLMGVWFAAILFMFQIYYHFSGYSDMAIGLGRIFGFRYRENFKRPYLALSVSEFCRRWYLSLGEFFRDYVYIPMGGNRMGKPRQVFNMLVAWVLAALWYGAGWNYIIWGLYFFAVLVIEKHYMSTLDTLPDWVCRCITLWLVLVGWIIFSHENFADLQAAFMAALGFGGMATAGLGRQILNSIPLLTVCFVGCTTFPAQVKRVFDGVCGMGRRRSKSDMVTPLRAVHMVVSMTVMCLLLWLCTMSMIGAAGTVSIFVYF